MIIRYPEYTKDFNWTVLQSDSYTYAKYKKAIGAHRRVIFLKEHTILFALAGNKTIFLGDEVLHVNPSSIVILKRGLYGMTEVVPDGFEYEALLLFFPDSMLQNFLRQHQLQPDKIIADPQSYVMLPTSDLLHSFREQYMLFFQNRAENMEAILQLKIQEAFLLLLAGEHRDAVLNLFQGITHAQPANIEYIVNTHLLQPLTLGELAQLSGRSLASFKRDFQQYFNCSPKKWINEKRLAHARMLLLNDDMNVSEVALACGFENVPHFIKIFKQEFGDTPHALRAKKATI
ncbi:AraC family transcriptional regulator [Chitinophaga sancti]|uniref:helix-turn-helix transcriptional regulator n=1 Tax=Chitinophaga sancti TaxID=1004 RepID=UPI002A74E677|nr:AraC family transcriptional regulator [Chitinophaga sancti]WPQ62822.1 AraC family transcriptional regulator [Chitinophaga sancti]